MYQSETPWRRVENAEFDLSMFPSLAQQRKMHCSLNVTIIILVVGNIISGEKEKKKKRVKEEQPEERSVERKDPSEGGETKDSGRKIDGEQRRLLAEPRKAKKSSRSPV